MPGQAQAIGRLEHHAVAAVAVVQGGDLGLFQQADQAPAALEVAEQALAAAHAGPGQHHPRLVAAPWPVEALPAFLLVEIVVFLAVEHKGGLHHIAHGLAAELEAQAHAAIGVEYVGQVAELVDRGEELRVETQALAMARVGHPKVAFLAQYPAQLLRQELLDAPGVGANHLPEHRQRGIAVGGGERVAAGEGAVPVVDDRPLPLAVEAGRRGLQDPLPGLFQRLHEERLANPAPLRAQAGGEQAAVGLGLGQLDALALEHALRQGLGHGLRVGGVAHLLQFQAHAGDLGEEGLQAQAVVAAHAFRLFAEQRQQGPEGGIQRPARALCLLLDDGRLVLRHQVLRRLQQRVGQRLATAAGPALVGQGVHQGDQG
ncbi:hypothetical protein D3C84_448560 [compost metagenome]